jgi:hypothetical protein
MNRPQLRLALFAGFLLIFPWFLRRRPRVQSKVTICMPASVVFPYINDLRDWPLWTVWSHRERMHYSYSESSVGAGAVQRWRGARMSGELRIVRSEPDSRIDYELRINGGQYELFGRIELHEDGACTRVVWKAVWERARNPYRRYLDLLLQFMLRRDFAKSLEHLRDMLEQPREYVEY